jgi:hypothetical protein
LCLNSWVDSTRFGLKWNKLKFRPLKLGGASGAENKGIFIKAAPGFEPGMKVLQTLEKPHLIAVSAFAKSFYPSFTPVVFCDARRQASILLPRRCRRRWSVELHTQRAIAITNTMSLVIKFFFMTEQFAILPFGQKQATQYIVHIPGNVCSRCYC